jgi:hypothetical protein
MIIYDRYHSLQDDIQVMATRSLLHNSLISEIRLKSSSSVRSTKE